MNAKWEMASAMPDVGEALASTQAIRRQIEAKALYVSSRQVRKGDLSGRRDKSLFWPLAQTVGEIVPPPHRSADKESIG
jgi:hypothetical protein